MAQWERLRPLKNYLQAPDKSGVYEIGFKRPGHLALQASAFGLHAAGYPHHFMPMYVGKHETSIRKRLGEHFIGQNSIGTFRNGSKASSSIKHYYEELLPELILKKATIPKELKFPLEGLYFTCFPVSDPTSFESFVRLANFKYPWNRKDEKSAAKKAIGSKSADFDYIYKPKASLFIG